MTRATRRGPWLPEEDQTLLQLVCSQGPNNWVRISQHMRHRSPKQCRERYHQNLKPTLNHEPISSNEGELIEQMVNEMGKRWAEIARRLGNRSDNAVKNWWNGSMNRRRRNIVHHGHGLKAVGPRAQPIPLTRSSKPTIDRPSHRRQDSTVSQFQASNWSESRQQQYLPKQTNMYQQAFVPEPVQYHQHGFPPSGNRGKYLPAQYSGPNHAYYPTVAQPVRQAVEPRLRQAPYSALERLAPSALLPSPHRQYEPPLISPAATELSHAPSLDRAPSLVSDTQSNCSISPKTVPSPRPNMPAPIDTHAQTWQGHNGFRRDSAPNLVHHRGTQSKTHLDEGYVSAIPQSAASDSKLYLPLPKQDVYRRGSADFSHPSHHHSTSMISPRTERPTSFDLSHTPKDSRMHVANLLH